MRALVLTDWWQLDVQEVPSVEPGPNEVLIDVVATGICGSDIHGYTGENGRRSLGQVMGHETVGRVARLGSGVLNRPDLAIGSPVTVNPVIACGSCAQCITGHEQACSTRSVIGVDPTIMSAFADQLVAPATNVVALPPGVCVELGALVEPLSVGYHALRRGGCSSSDTVLIVGGGPIGQACALAAQRVGAGAVVVSEPDSRRRDLLMGLGVQTVDPNATDDFRAAVLRVLPTEPDVVVDAVGTTATIGSCLSVAPLGGRIVLVGMGEPRVEMPAFGISVSERSVIGSFCYSAAEFAETARWIAEEQPKLTTLIQQRVDVAHGDQSFRELAKGESDASKVLVFFDESGL